MPRRNLVSRDEDKKMHILLAVLFSLVNFPRMRLYENLCCHTLYLLNESLPKRAHLYPVLPS